MVKEAWSRADMQPDVWWWLCCGICGSCESRCGVVKIRKYSPAKGAATLIGKTPCCQLGGSSDVARIVLGMACLYALEVTFSGDCSRMTWLAIASAPFIPRFIGISRLIQQKPFASFEDTRKKENSRFLRPRRLQLLQEG